MDLKLLSKIFLVVVLASQLQQAHTQALTVNNIALLPSGGGPASCQAGSYQVLNAANVSGNCISLTQNSFESGAIWVCDPIDLDESFKLNFQANFDINDSGDGIAFVLQTEGVPSVIGGAGGGIGYSVGNAAGCQGGNCIISPSLVTEFDIWDNSANAWDGSNPGLGNINDISCDHLSIQSDGVQLASNAVIPPTCLSPAQVTDGLLHDICLTWDVSTMEYSVYFDSVLIVNSNTDIRSFFANPNAVFWGFTAASGGANQNLLVCNVNMLTGLTSPTCVCAGPAVSTNVSSDYNGAQISCNGAADGQAQGLASAGVPAYSFLWDNGQTTSTATGLAAGTYNLTVVDASGCEAVSSVILTQPTAIDLDSSITNQTCVDSGSIAISATGGTANYTYQWDANASGQTTATATGLAANSYSMTVTDANGCTVEATGLIVSASPPLDSADAPLIVTTNSLDCDLTPIGAMQVQPLGSYSYLWSDGSTGQSLSGLDAGTYTVMVTDSNGCVIVQTGIVSAPFVPSINPFIDSFGMLSFTAGVNEVVIIDGGNDESGLGVTYLWESSGTGLDFGDNSSHSSTASSSISGSYTLLLTATSTDAYACTDSASLILEVEEVPFLGMPTAFSPGNGDGINDLFRPVGLTAEQILEFRIFNRFGQPIYKGDDLLNGGWDGTYLGAAQARDVYLYVLQYDLNDGNGPQTLRGEVSLLR